jgi:trans-2,3-dihydro-3-hydroxyanthranilate isomerase
MPNVKYFLTDVFTDHVFGGNPLAVFPEAGKLNKGMMQKIANEFNLSETTFVFPPENPANDCKVRIFTPRAELPMAGHPTIGTAFVLRQQRIIEPKNEDYFLFEEGVGDIEVGFQEGGSLPDLISMSQLLPHFGASFESANVLAEMLSLRIDQLITGYPFQSVSCGMPVLFVPVKDLAAIRSVKLRLDIWENYLAEFETKQIMVFTLETVNPESTVHTRFFAPALGVYEDPATGAASGPLGCYLVNYNIIDRKESNRIINEQGFELGRRSQIIIQIKTEDSQITSVQVSGRCVLVGNGQIHIETEMV